ncbi:MAG: ABC transporter permease, partial [Ignavibacteriae bacterium]|nr:ABC transporter permease [Ignavibacteriota bacterium]
MFKNNLKIAIRNLLKYKFYSFINATGLAIGIATCLLILLFVQDELNYDKYNEKAGRIYRVIADMKLGGNSFNTTNLGAPTAEALVNDFPEVEKAVRIKHLGSWFVQYGDLSFKETNVINADSTLFDIFTIPLLSGNPKTALVKPNTLVLNEKMAEKYFGNENPVGKMLILNNRDDFLVTGVFKNIPSNSHFHADFILSFNIKHGDGNDYWLGNMMYVTYILLQKNFDYKNFEAKLPSVVEK